MAYELSKKVVIDTEEFNDFAVGLSLPLKNGDGGFFEQNFTTFEQARSNLKNLLLTKRGERVLQPNFGSGLQDLLFEPIDEEFEGKLVDTITESVSTWLPYINIEDINVDMNNENKDNNRVGVEIKFKVGESLDLNSVTFTVGG
tara:strand:- start:5229 stop:5660 length:432 start_codon:yes stop_codon:yes gene_type:complete